MNGQELEGRLGTSTFNDVFLKIYQHEKNLKKTHFEPLWKKAQFHIFLVCKKSTMQIF